MKIIKLTVFAIFIFVLITSCSIVNRLKEKLDNKESDKKETTTEKEKTVSSGENDLKFYNTYIDVINKIQSAADDLQKDYLREVPEPKSLRKSSLVLVISSSLQVNTLESTIKQYKRSFYDNGDLAKLQPDNMDMKKEIEDNFKSVISTLEDYQKTASKVIGYYQN